MSTWSDGTSTNRTAAELEALTPNGFVASDIDADILPWDDPLGIGYASTFLPMAFGNQATFTTNRAGFAKFISGGLINFLRYNVFTQSGNICFAIYDNLGDGDAARPNNRLWTSGSFACPTATFQSLAVSPGIVVRARQHWLGFAADNATVSMYQMNTAQQNIPAVAGWGHYKDTAFPLPDPAGSVSTGGYFRMPACTGHRA
jgi:hypothetical protein